MNKSVVGIIVLIIFLCLGAGGILYTYRDGASCDPSEDDKVENAEDYVLDGMFGECVANSCVSGYTLEGNKCISSTPTPDSDSSSSKSMSLDSIRVGNVEITGDNIKFLGDVGVIKDKNGDVILKFADDNNMPRIEAWKRVWVSARKVNGSPMWDVKLPNPEDKK